MTTAPFVGPPSGDLAGGCAFALDLDHPVCTNPATVHLRVADPAWGMVGLLACDDHVEIAARSAPVQGRHPAGPNCSSPVTGFLPTHCEVSAVSEFARPFRITFPDGEVLDGVQFPSGRCVVDAHDPFSSRGLIEGATSFDRLSSVTHDAVVEWADEGGA